MHRSVPKLVHDQNWIFKPFNIKLSLPHGIIKTYVIILETSISVNKPILGSGTCSLSMISTHTPIVTKPWNRYIMIRDIPKGNFFSTNLANNICYPDVCLSCTVTVQDKLLSIRGNSQIFHYIQKLTVQDKHTWHRHWNCVILMIHK